MHFLLRTLCVCLLIQPNIVITGHLSQISTVLIISNFQLCRAVVNNMRLVKYCVQSVEVWVYLPPLVVLCATGTPAESEM